MLGVISLVSEFILIFFQNHIINYLFKVNHSSLIIYKEFIIKVLIVNKYGWDEDDNV